MMVLGHGLIFQPVLASLSYTQACTYSKDTIMTLQKNRLTDFPSEKKRERERERERERACGENRTAGQT